MIQEFHISVTPVNGKADEYLVRTERVAPGVPLAEEQVTWPVEKWLTMARQLLNDPVVGLLQTIASIEPDAIANEAEMPGLVALGQELYNNLFQGTLRDSWICAQSIAYSDGDFVHLRLGLKGRRLPQLPWEVMHRGDRPLATTDVIFSRYQPHTSFLAGIEKVPANRPLKILMAIAAPSDGDSLQLEREYTHLKHELNADRPDSPAKIELDILRQPDREQLTQALERGQYQIFHYAGHSSLGSSGGELHLVSGRTGLTETLSGEDIAGLLFNNRIQMAVFNSCRGAYSDPVESQDREAPFNLAEAIVNRGVPGVLAMAERIPDEVSLTLAQLFYRNIACGSSATESLSRARQGLVSAYGSHQLYWALPVLYLHSAFDGYFIDRKSERKPADEVREMEAMLRDQRDRNRAVSPSQIDTVEEINFPEDKELEAFLGEIDDDDDGIDLAEDAAIVAELFGEVTSAEISVAPSGNTSLFALAEAEGEESIIPDSKAIDISFEKIGATRESPGKTVKSRFGLSLKTVGISVISAAAVAIAFLAGFSPNREPQPGDLLPPLPTETISGNSREIETVNLDTTSTSEVTAIAIELLNSEDLSDGILAVESLLDRGALPQAKAALAAVSPELGNEAAINFLSGRLAWEFVQQGNSNYSIEDARRYWKSAAKQDPGNVEYLNALGFAYYAENQLTEAYKAWLKVLDLLDATEEIVWQTASSAAVYPEPFDRLEVLNAYSGIALAIMKSAENLSPQEQGIRLSKAIKFRQKVMGEAPLDFQVLGLSRNWMWSESAIRDWQFLLEM